MNKRGTVLLILTLLAAGIAIRQSTPARHLASLQAENQDSGDFTLASLRIRPLLRGEATLPGLTLVATGCRASGSTMVVDPSVANVDAAFAGTSPYGGSEPSIAVDPLNPDRLAVTGFAQWWGNYPHRASIWYSFDGGRSWTYSLGIPQPTGTAAGGPNDQTIDFSQNGRLVGTFMSVTGSSPLGSSSSAAVYTGSTDDPANPARWEWPTQDGVATPTVVGVTPLSGIGSLPTSVDDHYGMPDQPQVVTNRTQNGTGVNTYVGYIDQAAPLEDVRVAVAHGDELPVVAEDHRVSGVPMFPDGAISAIRLAPDHRTGAMWAIWLNSATPTGPDLSQLVAYMVSRSTDGGHTWSLGGSPNGLPVAEVLSNQNSFVYPNSATGVQISPKWGTVNATLGGVHSAAVDPRTGDLFYAYGYRDPLSGVNRLAMVRVHVDNNGLVTVSSPSDITTKDARLPAVAVTDDGTIGVLYDSFEGFSSNDHPTFAAHLAKSVDGIHFSDETLVTWDAVSAADRSFGGTDVRQREMGDYQQLKAVGNRFYGTFTGNGAPLGRPFAVADPLVVVSDTSGVNPPACANAGL